MEEPKTQTRGEEMTEKFLAIDNNEILESDVYLSIRDLMTKVSYCKTDKELREIDQYIQTNKKKYALNSLHALQTHTRLKKCVLNKERVNVGSI